ncbi:MAG: AbrB/MazE/SpoVT family DNA-binding domain-containing protein, partial [Planctomycetota bacterium]
MSGSLKQGGLATAIGVAMMGAHVDSGQDTQEGIAKTSPVAQESESSAPAELWRTRAGITTMSFDLDAVADAGLRMGEPDAGTVVLPDAWAQQLVIKPGSSLTFSVVGGSLEKILDGRILHLGDVRLIAPQGEFVLADPLIVAPHDDAFGADWVVESRTSDHGLILRRMKGAFDGLSRTLTIRSADLRISPGLAEAMGDPKLAEAILGGVTIRAAADWVGGAKPAGDPDEPLGGERSNSERIRGCNMTFCQLYGFYMPTNPVPARVGDVVGLSVATTSWGVGTEDCMWFPMPNEEHPFIVMNMYRLKD